MSLSSRLFELARTLPWLRERAGRAVDAVVAVSSVPPPGLRPGTWALPRTPATDDTPIVLVDCTDVSGEQLARLVDDLPRVSANTQGARFVLVVDGPQLAVGRRGGIIVEQLVDAAAWARRHDPASWQAYRLRRFEQLRETYLPGQVVLLPSGDAGELQQAIVRRPPPTVVRRALTRAERWIDPPLAR